MSIWKVLTRLFYRVIGWLVALRDARNATSKYFPVSQGRNFLYEPLLPDGDGEAYFTKYRAELPVNPLAVDFNRFKTEIVKGVMVPAGSNHVQAVDGPSALPVAVTGVDITAPDDGYEIRTVINNEEVRLGNLPADRFLYLPIPDGGEVGLNSDQDIIVGRPIPLKQGKRHRARLVLVLFIDSFGWDIMERPDISDELPNIRRLMDSGTTFDNSYSSSNWTLPGVGTIVSGRSLSRHGMFHSMRHDVGLGDGYRILPEYFSADGYLTFQVCGNSRRSPAYGYVKGFDRTVYKNEISIADTMDATFDHLRAFPDRDQFIWLTFMDAHHTLNKIPDVVNQLAVPLSAHDYTVEDAKSPLRLKANEAQTLRHIEELKRIDFHLGRLFAFLDERYGRDEMLICVTADHGTGFVTADSHELSHEMTHVAFLLRGPGVPAGKRSDEIVQNTDILPALLHVAGIPFSDNIDGRLPETLGGPSARSYALAEIMFQHKPYQAAIKDGQFEFYLTSEGVVDDDGQFSLGQHTTSLFPHRDWTRDIGAEHPDVVKNYSETVKRHLEGRGDV